MKSAMKHSDEEYKVTLSPREIYEITHRKRAAEQVAELLALGIPAKLRAHDNTVCVLRAYVINPGAAQIVASAVGAAPPLRKSVRTS
jgi:hypothetical protein